MGLLPAIMSRGYRVKELQQIDRSGKRISGLAVNVFDRLTGGRFTSLPRSELAASIYGALNQGVETIFDDSITTIADLGHEVRVGFERSRALVFDARGERWPEDRREGLQGLSEREAAELVARTLLTHWGVRPEGTVQVDRASGAPYAVAYVDGILRINPAFLYLAAAYGLASMPATLQ